MNHSSFFDLFGTDGANKNFNKMKNIKKINLNILKLNLLKTFQKIKIEVITRVNSQSIKRLKFILRINLNNFLHQQSRECIKVKEALLSKNNQLVIMTIQCPVQKDLNN